MLNYQRVNAPNVNFVLPGEVQFMLMLSLDRSTGPRLIEKVRIEFASLWVCSMATPTKIEQQSLCHFTLSFIYIYTYVYIYVHLCIHMPFNVFLVATSHEFSKLFLLVTLVPIFWGKFFWFSSAIADEHFRQGRHSDVETWGFSIQVAQSPTMGFNRKPWSNDLRMEVGCHPV